MAFLFNIPQSTDQLSISQGNILNNFTILGAIAGNLNASSASINATSGFNWLYLPNNGATPPAGSSFPAGDIALYSSLNATTGQNELYINKRNQATIVQIPATASVLSQSSAPGIGGIWTYLPSGILMKSGRAEGAFSGLATITVSSGGTSGPAFTQISSIMVCPWNDTSTGDLNFAVRLVDINGANTFRIYISSRTSTGAASGQTGYSFIALGY